MFIWTRDEMEKNRKGVEKSAVGPLCFKHAGVHAPPLIKALYIGKSKKIQPNLKVNYIQNENEDIAGMRR